MPKMILFVSDFDCDAKRMYGKDSLAIVAQKQASLIVAYALLKMLYSKL